MNQYVFHTSDGTYISPGRNQTEAYRALLEYLQTADIAINGCYKVKAEIPIPIESLRKH